MKMSVTFEPGAAQIKMVAESEAERNLLRVFQSYEVTRRSEENHYLDGFYRPHNDAPNEVILHAELPKPPADEEENGK